MNWKSIAGIGVGLVSAALIWKGYKNTKYLGVTEETVTLADLPLPFEGFRILQLSDLHLRRNSTRGDEVLSIVDKFNPDLVCLTGDYTFTWLSLADVERFFQSLAQRPAVVGVFGNSDYREGISDEVRARW